MFLRVPSFLIKRHIKNRLPHRFFLRSVLFFFFFNRGHLFRRRLMKLVLGGRETRGKQVHPKTSPRNLWFATVNVHKLQLMSVINAIAYDPRLCFLHTVRLQYQKTTSLIVGEEYTHSLLVHSISFIRRSFNRESQRWRRRNETCDFSL